jgi:DNA-binding MarR family transcriptional regulator
MSAGAARGQPLDEFVEGFALWFEASGVARVAGRVLGWLLVCEPAHQSAEQLAQALQVSRGSVSTNTRLLGVAGLIERVSLPGDRRLYYRAIPDWNALLEAQHRKVVELRQLIGKGQGLLAAEPAARRERLDAIFDFASFWEDELAAQLERRRQPRQGGGA